MPIMRVITPLLAAVVLIACANPSATVPADPSPTPDTSAQSAPSEKLAEVVAEPLPEAIQDRVRAAHAEYRNMSVEQVRIVRHSRETWSDGCLGLGGPAESCLAALTEGWQVEVTDPEGGSTFYRTNLTGNSIRRSTLESNLPPSVGDRD